MFKDVGACRARLCVWPALTYIIFIDEFMAVHIFVDLLYGITHGFDITHDQLVMAWHFKDIVIFVILDFDK